MRASFKLSRPEGHTLWWWIGLATLAGLTIGAMLLPRARVDREPRAARVQLYDREIALDDRAAKAALELVRERLSHPLSLGLPEGRKRSFSPAQLGVQIDRTRLRELLAALRDPASAFARRRAPSDRPVRLVVPARIDSEKAIATLLPLKRELDREPRSARIDVHAGHVREDIEGRLLDLDRSLEAILKAVEEGRDEAELAFETLAPERRASELERVDYATVLGAFDTPYDRSARAQARTFNLRLAASRLDGSVLLPGQIFDFNRVVGPRDEAHGYQVAKVIASGELVDGIGGGTCQISGTLHAAALFAGLQVVERYPHTRPSSYIKLGFDATVVYPAINFRLKNPFDFPVVIHARVEDGSVHAEVRGARRPQRVTVIRRIDSATPYAELERPDPDLPRGARRIAQQGVPGLTLHRYRVLRQGRHAVRERVSDRYPPTPRIVRVGTGSGEAPGDEREATVEDGYAPDELLVMSQSRQPGGALRVERVPGRFGQPGWSRQLASSAKEPDG